MDPRYNKTQKQRGIGDDTVLDCFFYFRGILSGYRQNMKKVCKENLKKYCKLKPGCRNDIIQLVSRRQLVDRKQEGTAWNCVY